MQQKSSYCKDVVKDVEHLQPADSDDINLTNLDLLKKKKTYYSDCEVPGSLFKPIHYTAVGWLAVEETRPHDSISPQAATAATALTLVSCSGIRQIYHGNRETEQEKYNWERRRWWSHVCGIQYSNKVGILGFLLLKISFFSPYFPFCIVIFLWHFHLQEDYFVFLLAHFFKIKSQKYFLEIFGALYSNSSIFYMMYYICCQNSFCELS